jgi:small multidrug resistance pump
VGYLFLAAAIGAEVGATLSLRAADGFFRLPWSIVVVVGYVAAFVFLSFALQRELPLGVAYAVWAAAGVAAVALLSVPLFGETLSALQIAGVLLVIAGVVAVEAGGR